MLTRLGDPRTTRALKAILLTAVLAFGGSLALGLATAHDPAEDADTPFALPAPHDGDHGSYLVQRVVAHENGPLEEGPETPYYEFAWNGTGQTYDRDGRHHHTNRLEMVGPFPHQDLDDERTTWHFSQEDGVAVAQETSHNAVLSTQVGIEERTFAHDMRYLAFWAGRPDLLPCGLHNTLQANNDDPIAGPLFPGCRLPGSVRDLGVMDYAFIGSATHDGHRYAWYHAEGNLSEAPPAPPGETPLPLWPNVTVTFRDDMPYPVRLEVGPLDDGSSRVIRLTSFERGEHPLEQRVSDVPPLPPVALADRPTRTIDDTGVDHPYPFSEAFEEALDDEETGLRAFLQEHPKAAVIQIDHHAGQQEDGDHWRWSFRVGDGDAGLWVCRERVDRGTGDLLSPLKRPLVEGPPCYDDTKRAPPMPDQTPPMAALVANAHTIAARLGIPLEPTGWEMRATCGDSDCTRAELSISVVDEWYRHGPQDRIDRFRGAPVSTLATWITFDADGRARGILLMKSTENADPAQEPRPVDPTPLALDVTSVPAWQIPRAAQAAGIGALAAVVGLLYWLWPAVKQGFASALFSRIDRPKALRHEARARLLAVIEAEPGLHASEIVRRSGLARGVVRHHLEKLTENGLVRETRGHGRTTYVTTGTDTRLAQGLAAVGSDGATRLVAHVAAHPDASAAAAARALGLSRQAVSRHVKRLERAGVLVARPDGRTVRLRLTAEGHEVRKVRRGHAQDLA